MDDILGMMDLTSKWQGDVALNDYDSQSGIMRVLEWIVIEKGLGVGSIYRLRGYKIDGQDGKMEAQGGLRLTERRAHGLCFLIANQRVTHVTG